MKLLSRLFQGRVTLEWGLSQTPMTGDGHIHTGGCSGQDRVADQIGSPGTHSIPRCISNTDEGDFPLQTPRNSPGAQLGILLFWPFLKLLEVASTAKVETLSPRQPLPLQIPATRPKLSPAFSLVSYQLGAPRLPPWVRLICLRGS